MRPTWYEIPVNDVEVSKKFYAKVLGWDYDVMSEMTFFKDEAGPFGHFWPAKQLPHKGKLPKYPQVMGYYEVKSIATVLGKVGKNGGTVVQPKSKLPGGMGSIAVFSDPIGVIWGLHSQK